VTGNLHGEKCPVFPQLLIKVVVLILVSELNAYEIHDIEEESVHLLSVCHILPLAEGEPVVG